MAQSLHISLLRIRSDLKEEKEEDEDLVKGVEKWTYLLLKQG
jgi:hypothetical protein